MGKYNPSEAVELTTTPDEYPIWKTERPLIVPRKPGLKHTYLYCLHEGGKFKEWEFEGAQRFVVCESAKMEVWDSYGDVSAVKLLQGPSPVAMNNPAVQHVVDPSSEGKMRASDSALEYSKQSASLGMFPHEEKEDRQPNCFDGVFKLLRTLSQQRLSDHSQTSDDQLIINRRDGQSAVFKARADTTLFLVCYHLPVKVFKGESGKWKAKWSESLLAKGDDSISMYINTHWVGTVNVPGDITEQDRTELREVLAEMDCTPVFISKELEDGHYKGFCKQLLWPAFHNVDILELASSSSEDHTSKWDQTCYSSWYETYMKVNHRVADAVQPMLKKGDVVWVHDYHLMPLPKILHDRQIEIDGKRTINMVFFLHIPFPTSQIFRALFCGSQLLEGMLSADVVGFHAFDHARHFLNATKRLMGLAYHSRKGGLIGVEYLGRLVMVVMSHVGIEPQQLNRALESPEYQEAKETMMVQQSDRTAIIGLDVLQRLSGVTLKLMAYEKLLKEYPIWRNRVVLIQWALIPGNRPADEDTSSRMAKELVQRIQEQFGEESIEYHELRQISLAQAQRLALWARGDIFITTAIRDGLNLWPLEYLFAHRSPEPPGLVLASEFSACASLLNGALRINPFNIAGTATVLDQALSMDQMEKEGRRTRDLQFISARPSALWTRQILADMWSLCGQAGEDQQQDEASVLADRDICTRGHTRLNATLLTAAFKQTCRRVFLFDYGGTLIHTEASGKYLKDNLIGMWDRTLSPALTNALTELTNDPSNVVFVVSGLPRQQIERTFKKLPNIGLAASSGMAYSWPDDPHDMSPRQMIDDGGERESTVESIDGRVWTIFDYGVDWAEVKDIALPILNRVTARTNGSMIKILDPGISWDFYATDPEWGQKMTKVVVAELTTALAAYDVQITQIRNSIDIIPNRLHKGTVVRRILKEQVEMKGMPDFIFCVGDDVTDEYMHKSIYAFLADHGTITKDTGAEETPVKKVFTCCVGAKPSYANLYVDDVKEVENAICSLVS
eukprot:CAMPEP_0117747192 /NCGR_PEP_ID=MMETSP0947-20121206/8366_1 /TAXON_ID=44440 /ORGANISM="Chattonella subsalsa, Strain CCMP2191" /LENGTH=1015 /DNA_ID=CAMNT_0005564601 /DNA_START=124 /DNA_END=3171 /DNA_ORIENTATION=+